MANEEEKTTSALATKEFNAESGVRVFNIDGVKSSLSTIKGLFNDFANDLKTANDLVAFDVNQSCDHCVFGAHGAALLNLWEANASTFDSFNANFESWSQAIAVISARNAEFTNIATDTYNNRKYSDSFLTYTDANGNTRADVRSTYLEENAIESTDASGNKVKSYFDENGNFVVKTYDAQGNVINTRESYYDENGNLVVKTMDADGKVIGQIVTSYDDAGRVVKVEETDAAGVKTTTNSTYDADGRLIATTTVDALGNEKSSTTYSYDANGNLLKVETKENGNVVQSETYTYNENGLVESVTVVENGQTTTTTNTYDENGNITSVTTDTGDGNPTTTTYNRETTSTTNPDGTVTSETTVTRTKPDGTVTTETTTTTTDSNGKITSIETVTTDSEGNTSTVTTTYDGEGNPTTSDPTYADKDGNPLTEKPDSFNEDGTINDNPPAESGEGENPEVSDPNAGGEDPEVSDPNAGGEDPEVSDPNAGGEDPEVSDPNAGGEDPEQGENLEGDSEQPVENASVTIKSGDEVSISGAKYNVYGFTKTVDGRVIPMYADKEGYLYYEDGNGQLQQVLENYGTTAGSGNYAHVVRNTRPATINSVDTSATGPYGSTINSNLVVGDLTVASSSDIIGSATFENGSLADSVTVIDNQGSAYTNINVGNTVTTDGNLLQSYEGNINSVVNGDTVVTAASMNDFTTYVKNNPDVNLVIRIPQGTDVQWDPSSAAGNGYNFQTDDGSVYLKWNSAENGYQIVDEYGNIKNSKVYTLDGFNTNHGKWK